MTRVLILNTGSSSVKWALLTADKTVITSGSEPWAAEESNARTDQLKAVLKQVPRFDAVGHRIVHGGSRFCEAVIIDKIVRGQLVGLIDLDPEHMLAALAGIDAVTAAFPSIPQIAVFDTAFHASMPEAAAGYGLPFEWTQRWGLHRFGFHGLSVAYAVERTNELLSTPHVRLIVCHLGSGCSVTAVKAGRSVDTSMGFSPLEGLMMATRSGSVDPGVLLYLQQHCHIGVDEIRETLTKRSGLFGVSGVSGDLREVLEAANNGAPRARLAYERFVLSIRRALGMMAGVLGGVDAVVFTGGIGENNARLRRDVTRALKFAGLVLDDDANASDKIDRNIAAAGSQIQVLVLHAREDLSILKEVLRLRYNKLPEIDISGSNDTTVIDRPRSHDFEIFSDIKKHVENESPAQRSDELQALPKPISHSMPKLIVFDLDGTLAASKAALDTEMATLFNALLRVVKVAVISGGAWPQFQSQLLAQLAQDERLRDLSLLPTCGTQFYQYASDWTLLYAENFSDEEKEQIITALKQAIKAADLQIETTWGEQIQDRSSQITFSALGQKAPIAAKETWDPDFTKRKKVQSHLEELLPEFSVRLGGTTSIDVTKLGIDKGYGMHKLRDTLGIQLDEMLFIGDALFPGGNDYPAKEAGVASIQVRDPDESKRVIEVLLACLGRDQQTTSHENGTR